MQTGADECKEMKEFLNQNDKCGHKYGETFVIDARFWEEREEPLEEEKWEIDFKILNFVIIFVSENL